MSHHPYELTRTDRGVTATIRSRGRAVLTSPTINRGTAFTLDERRALDLIGLLPTEVSTLAQQLRRVYAQYREQPTDLRKWVYLASLRDRNEVLFYRLLAEHLTEMMPIVYTPTVGTAIERFSHEFSRPRGVYLSVDRPGHVEEALRSTGLGPDDVDLLVATDSEGILGIGDQGIGGIEIAIGKLSLYTAAAGIHPRRAVPVVFDMGTDNKFLLDDDLYLGARHPRVRDDRYDQLLDAYVAAVKKLFPHAMLHWEDFGASNARRVLDRYRDTACTFNDDMQGTAAVVTAAVLSATRAAGTVLADQTIVIHGAGTAGLGIADMLRDLMIEQGVDPAEATRRFYALGSRGLLVQGDPQLRDFQHGYARTRDEVADWMSADGRINLAETVWRVRPTVLIGTSAQTGAFTEQIVRSMADHVERPVILPLSNPTDRAEARPQDLVAWTDGRVLTATGSPFPPVTWGTRVFPIAQANNALVFPGLGLGVTVARASRVSDSMIAAAADAVARLSDATAPGASLLPSMNDLQQVSHAVAVAVVRAAVAGGLARSRIVDIEQQVSDAMWLPEYPELELA